MHSRDKVISRVCLLLSSSSAQEMLHCVDLEFEALLGVVSSIYISKPLSSFASACWTPATSATNYAFFSHAYYPHLITFSVFGLCMLELNKGKGRLSKNTKLLHAYIYIYIYIYNYIYKQGGERSEPPCAPD